MIAQGMEHAALARRCLGLPVERAQALCAAGGWQPRIVYTGERAAQEGLTPRVIAFQQDALVAACFRDGDPREDA